MGNQFFCVCTPLTTIGIWHDASRKISAGACPSQRTKELDSGCQTSNTVFCLTHIRPDSRLSYKKVSSSFDDAARVSYLDLSFYSTTTMATMYQHPAAANYYAAQPHAMGKPARTYRICDQCGAAESNARFRVCGGCLTTQYCSDECQRSHWADHKRICKHTTMTKEGVPDKAVVQSLRRFTTNHQTLLNWAGYQALRVKRHPENIRRYGLLVNLQLEESAALFSVQTAQLVPLEFITDGEVIGQIKERDARSRANGGIGALTVILQCGTISQVMPVEVDHPARITWDTRDDWEVTLRHFIAHGRTDFRPISTTPRGIVYG
ncbi:hypothetical protein DL96DRAFT_1587581, partial [Flagelloscypha sp. PMI_526]